MLKISLLLLQKEETDNWIYLKDEKVITDIG